MKAQLPKATPTDRSLATADRAGFADLRAEAIYGFDVKDMPVAVAVSADGTSAHDTRPKEW